MNLANGQHEKCSFVSGRDVDKTPPPHYSEKEIKHESAAKRHLASILCATAAANFRRAINLERADRQRRLFL
jgi:hypothetical protein